MGCGGRGGAIDEQRSSGRRSRVVLTPRRWCQVGGTQVSLATVAKQPGRRGEHEISRKPPCREGRIASAEPVCSCAFSILHFARETAGAARTRLSLRPQGRRIQHNSSASRREDADVCFLSSRRTPGPVRRGGCFERRRSAFAKASADGSTAFAQQPRPVVMGPGSRPGRQPLLLRRLRFARNDGVIGDITPGVIDEGWSIPP
jgi:hypothetical protein